MKKVIIITLHGANYGNRLQNFALQEVLSQMNCSVINVSYRQNAVFKLIKRTTNLFRDASDNSHSIEARNRIFNDFNCEYITNLLDVGYFNVRKIPKNEIDFAITGSDQVWHNWDRFRKSIDFFYLKFMPKLKRIAYAPSFGFAEFPTKFLRWHKDGLMGFDCNKISIREAHGAKLIKRLNNIDVPVVPDPTLLLRRTDWEKIAKKPVYDVPEHFAVQYFLGNVHDYQSDLPIIDVNNSNKSLWYKNTGPSEFIWLIQHSDYVYTDSFHACVFSIIFHKKFVVFRRRQNGMEKMFDRIETLLCNTDLEQNIEKYDDHVINWEKVDEEIEKRRKIGIDFLKNALG